MSICTQAVMLSRLARTIGPDLIVNIGLPFLVYSLAAPHWGEERAMIASAAPPMLWGTGELLLRRRMDALSLLSIAGIVLSLLVLLGGGSVRWLQLREKLATGAIAVVLIGSCLTGHPLLLTLMEAGAARAPDGKGARLRILTEQPGFYRQTLLLTLVWGLGLLGDVAVSAALVFVIPISLYLVINPLLGYAVMGALSLWTFRFARRHGLNGVLSAG